MNDNIPWLERLTEEAIEPDLKICDPHHHLWIHPNSRYLVDEFLQDISGGHRILKTIYVECLQHYYQDGPEKFKCVGETSNVHKMTQQCQQENASTNFTTKVAAGIVGFADLLLGEEVQEILDAHIAASDRFRGIRHASAWHESNKIHNAHTKPDKNLLQNASFLKGLRCLEKMQLTFDAWCFFTQIPELTELAKAYPDLSIVLNHIGGPIGIGPYKDQRDQVFEQWKSNIIALSQCPNVVVKLGGRTMTMAGFNWHKRETPPGSIELAQAMAPYYNTCIEHFGVNRCMFESNFPVDKASCSYTVQWNAFKRMSQHYSAAERAALFHDTAVNTYKL